MLSALIVYLDGEEITHVLDVNTKEGWLIKAKLPIEIDQEKEEVVTETLYGQIDVIATA